MELINTDYKLKISHLGELLLKALKECPDPNHINQIDATTGEEETFASFLKRSVAMAYSLRVYGAKAGDVIAIAGRNNIHVHVPFYAAMYNGIAVAGVDPTYQYDETKALFETTKPKLVFCNQNSLQYMEPAAKDLNLKIKFIALDGDYNLDSFMKEYPSNGTVEDFKVTEIDTKTAYCWLMSTSGTSGRPKQAAFTHYDTAEMLQIITNSKRLKEPIYLNLSPLQWASGYYNATSSTLSYTTRVQMSGSPTLEATVEAINKYKPNGMMCSAPLITLLLNYKGECDLSCFNVITIGGSKAPQEEIIELKKRIKGFVIEFYGQTETVGPVFIPDQETPIGSVGKPYPRIAVKLIDTDTEEVITEPNKIGHLLVKGPRFVEYYKSPKATAEAFTDDGWYKTGDLLYRDENNNYYFVERINMLIKYMGIHIFPPLLEEAIRTHEGVQEVVVVGIPMDQSFEIPAACVVRKPGSKVTAQEIKDIVASKFADEKHLRGGVVFMDEMILTSTGKVARHKLREFALNAKRE